MTIANPVQGNMYAGGNSTGLIGDEGTANYNGMIVTLQHRLSNTFSLMTNWTWSKCLDIEDAQGDLAGGTVENPNDPAMDYGPCGSDYRHIVNLSLIAKSEFHWTSRLMRLALNNWELAPLMETHSGGPLNVTAGGDFSLTDVGNDRPNLIPGVNPYHEVTFQKAKTEGAREYLNPAAFAEVTTPGYGNIGRNAFRGPAFFNIDAQISRLFPIHERYVLDLRLESFNMLNHPNFGGVDTNVNHLTSTFGQVSSASAARLFQGAVKVSF